MRIPDLYLAPSISQDGHHVSTLRNQWRQVFWIAAALNYIGALLFVLMSSGEVQPWAEAKQGSAEGMEELINHMQDTDHTALASLKHPNTQQNGELVSDNTCLEHSL